MLSPPVPTNQHLLGHLQILPVPRRKHNFLLLPWTLFRQPPRRLRVHLTFLIFAMSTLTQRRTGQAVLITLAIVLLAIVLWTGTPFGEPLHHSVDLHLHKRALKGFGIDVESGLAHVLDELNILHGVVAAFAATLRAAEPASSEADAVESEAFALCAVAAFLGFWFFGTALSGFFGLGGGFVWGLDNGFWDFEYLAAVAGGDWGVMVLSGFGVWGKRSF